MAGQASSVGSKVGLDAITGRATQTARTTYLALLTAAPSDSATLGTMAELAAGNGYARQSVTWSDPTTTEETHNTNVLTFGPFTTDFAPVTHVALVSAASGTSGDFLYYWTLDTARDPANGDSIQFAASALSASLE